MMEEEVEGKLSEHRGGRKWKCKGRKYRQPWLWLLGVQREKEKSTGIQTKENREERRLEAFKTPVDQVLNKEPPYGVLWSFRTEGQNILQGLKEN